MTEKEVLSALYGYKAITVYSKEEVLTAMKEYGDLRFAEGRDAALDRLHDNWKFYSKEELEGMLDSLKQNQFLQP